MGRAEVIHKPELCIFDVIPLLVFVCSMGASLEKSGMLILKTNLATYCHKSAIGLPSLFFHTVAVDCIALNN